MTAEMFKPEMTPEKPENELNEVMGQRAMELADVQMPLVDNEYDIKEEVARARERFAAAFSYNWQPETISELFDRIAGVDHDLSDELNGGLTDLYLKSKLLQHEARPSYSKVFDLFTRQKQSIRQIEQALHDEGDEIDLSSGYVPRHVLTVIDHISRHEA